MNQVWIGALKGIVGRFQVDPDRMTRPRSISFGQSRWMRGFGAEVVSDEDLAGLWGWFGTEAGE